VNKPLDVRPDLESQTIPAACGQIPINPTDQSMSITNLENKKITRGIRQYVLSPEKQRKRKKKTKAKTKCYPESLRSHPPVQNTFYNFPAF